MFKFMIVVVAVAVMSVGFACTGPTTVRTSFTVEGMHCESCSTAITDALEKVDGVVAASADHDAGRAEATYRSPGATPERLAAEIEGLGYTVVAMSTVPVES
jgi:copper chaperone CopZ